MDRTWLLACGLALGLASPALVACDDKADDGGGPTGGDGSDGAGTGSGDGGDGTGSGDGGDGTGSGDGGDGTGSGDDGSGPGDPSCAALGEVCQTRDCCEREDIRVVCGSGPTCVDATHCPPLGDPCTSDADCCADILAMYCNTDAGECWER